MPSSMKAIIHLGPDVRMNFENYMYTTFENIENVLTYFKIFMEDHCEEILNVRGLEYSSPSWTRSILVERSSDQVGESESLCLRRFCSVCWSDGTRSRIR